MMKVCRRSRMRVCVYACLRVCPYVCLRACLQVCMSACLHTCMSACQSACMSVCQHVCIQLLRTTRFGVLCLPLLRSVVQSNGVANMCLQDVCTRSACSKIMHFSFSFSGNRCMHGLVLESFVSNSKPCMHSEIF